jgi:hypothetical protein
MLFWIVLVILVAIVGATFLSKQQQMRGDHGHGQPRALPFSKDAGKKPKKKKDKKENLPRTLLNMQINDVVSHFETDYIVRAKAIYEEEGEQWFEYMLEGGSDGTVWLNILPNGDDVDAQFYKTVTDLTLTEEPQKTLIYQGRTYRLQRKGEASAERESATTGTSQGVYKYFAYESDDGGMLSVEAKTGGQYEVSVGENIRAFALQILPGDEITAQSEQGL